MRAPLISSIVVVACATPTQNDLPGDDSTSAATGSETVGPSTTTSTGGSGATDPSGQTDETTAATSSGSTGATIESGSVLWTETYSTDIGASQDYATDVDVSEGGQVLVVGVADSDPESSDPPLGGILLWYDADGELLEEQLPAEAYARGEFGGPGYILATPGESDGTVDGTVAGFDATHTHLWTRPLADTAVVEIAVDADGDTYVAGRRFAGGPVRAKLDGSSNVVWQDVDAAEDGACGDVALIDEGAMFLCANVTRWVDRDGNTFAELAQELSILEAGPDGGWAGANGSGVFGFDAAGTELWHAAGAPIDDLAIDGAGNVVAVGTTTGITVAKYTPDGSELWSSTYDHPEPSFGYGVAIAPDDSVVAVGLVSNVDIGQGLDVWVRKYAP